MLSLIPNVRADDAAEATADAGQRTGVIRSFLAMLTDLELVKTIVTISLPAKAVLTGVIIFALPLTLTQLDFVQEDIGQIIMLYAAGVLLASHYVSRRVDRVGKTTAVLFWGSVVCALGLLLIGVGQTQAVGSEIVLPYFGALPGLDHIPYLATGLIIAGVLILGLAHGFINAPVVTHVADTASATQIGRSSATATYRFLERIGHVAGPILIAEIFILTRHDPLTIAYIGAAVAVLGLLLDPFVLDAKQRDFLHPV